MRTAKRPKKMNIEPQMAALIRYLEAQNDVLAAGRSLLPLLQ